MSTDAKKEVLAMENSTYFDQHSSDDSAFGRPREVQNLALGAQKARQSHSR
jgi:hypothetical protein